MDNVGSGREMGLEVLLDGWNWCGMFITDVWRWQEAIGWSVSISSIINDKIMESTD